MCVCTCFTFKKQKIRNCHMTIDCIYEILCTCSGKNSQLVGSTVFFTVALSPSRSSSNLGSRQHMPSWAAHGPTKW